MTQFVMELKAAIASGLIDFKAFIEQKLEQDNDYLDTLICMPDNTYQTVLNYLIQQHLKKNTETPAIDLTNFIDFVLEKTHYNNVDEPLHEAISAGKIALAIHLLDKDEFSVNQRDISGSTLLSLVLTTKNEDLLRAILRKQPNIHKVTLQTKQRIPYQPLHQAITENFVFAVRELATAGAKLNNPAGPLQETPLLLAARLGKIDIVEVLLECSAERLDLGAESIKPSSTDSKHGRNAIEVLCKLFEKGNKKKELIKGIAMLLSHGAEPPRSDEMRTLLTNNRKALLQAVNVYMETRPDLVEPFVKRCHLVGGSLHSIMYVQQPFGYAFRQLFGRPASTAFAVEKLVTRKFTANLSKKAGETFTGNEEPLMLYAEFVNRYKQMYRGKVITNPWSKMRWMISGGCSWDAVLSYAAVDKNVNTRTRLVIDSMLGKGTLQTLVSANKPASDIPSVASQSL